jgi:hypothetical protein
MHKHFSDWYREIGLVPTPELLEKRWAAVETIVKDINDKELLALVCTLNHSGHCYPQYAEKFVQYFYNTDTTFPMRNNQNELRVLAGACLAEIFLKSEDFALIAAAGTISSSFAIPSAEPPFVDVTRDAANALAQASYGLRADFQYNDMPSYGPQLDAALQALKTQAAANNLQQVQLVTPLIDGLLKTETMLIELAKKSQGFVAQAQCRIETLAEECNVLWWLFAGHSDNLKMAFTEIDKKALPIIVGKELANLITNLPGPTSVKAILAKAIQCPQKGNDCSHFKISEAVNALTPEWRASIAESDRTTACAFPCVFPLHVAIAIAVDLGVADWDKAFIKKIDHLKSDSVFSSTELAYQFYLESLILQYVDVKE